MPGTERLRLCCRTGIDVENGGLFTSRGRGTHPQRILQSYELIYVRSGELRLREETRRFILGPGEALLLWPQRLHRGIGRFPIGLQFYWVHFRLDDRAVAANHSPDLSVTQRATVAKPDRMEELFRLFLDEQESGRLNALRASAYMVLMLEEMRPAAQADKLKLADVARQAGRAHEYIKTHSHEPIHSRLIAEHLHINPDYLGRLYRQAFGITITDAIRQERLKRGRDSLVHSDANVSEIASECGFASPSYFRRLFKKTEGMSPTHWRKLHNRMHVNTA